MNITSKIPRSKLVKLAIKRSPEAANLLNRAEEDVHYHTIPKIISNVALVQRCALFGGFANMMHRTLDMFLYYRIQRLPRGANLLNHADHTKTIFKC